MISSFLTVGQLVLVLLLIIIVGFILGKKQFITDQGNKTLSNVVMYAVVPCMLITSFQRELNSADLKNFGLCFLIAIVVHGLSILLSFLFLRDKDKNKELIFRFIVIFSNCGFMAYPLEQAIFGDIGIFFGSAFVAVFYLFAWTFGVYMVTGDRKKLSVKPILLNPGVLGVILALLFYVLQIKLPTIIYNPMSYLAALNTPIPMLILGYQLSKADIKSVLKEGKFWGAGAIRLVAVPLLTLGLCMLLGLDKTLATVLVIAASTPPATILSMFCAMFDKESSIASSVISTQTIIAVVTMPLMIGLASAVL